MRMHSAAVVSTALALVASSPSARADVVTIGPSKDNTIYAPSGTVSNGAGESFFTGGNAMSGVRRAFLAFDVAAAVPPGSLITQVELHLAMTMTMAGALSVDMRRATSDWGEGTSD